MVLGKEFNILIVDDVAENIQVAMNILQEENYSFSFASDGIEALEIISSTRFDLILLDIMMPLKNGYDVCRELKSKDDTKDIPIIFLTAKSDIDSMSQGFKLGGSDYIVKPFHAEELLHRVKNHLELAHARNILKQHNISLSVKAELQQERLVKEVEENLINLLKVFGQHQDNNVVERIDNCIAPDGPVVPSAKQHDVVSGQDEVDDLLSSLGF